MPIRPKLEISSYAIGEDEATMRSSEKISIRFGSWGLDPTGPDKAAMMLRSRSLSLLRSHPATAFLTQSRWFRGGESGSPRRVPRREGGRGKSRSTFSPAPPIGKSEWWAVDGEMHEIGEGVPRRERFVIPRDNLPIKKRKQMREQFMRRTRLLLKDSVLVSHS